jgi:hypothetical protein
MNNGTATAWIRFGDSTVAAVVANDLPVPAGEIEVFTLDCPAADALYMAAIAAGSTGSLYVTPGAGI